MTDDERVKWQQGHVEKLHTLKRQYEELLRAYRSQEWTVYALAACQVITICAAAWRVWHPNCP